MRRGPEEKRRAFHTDGNSLAALPQGNTALFPKRVHAYDTVVVHVVRPRDFLVRIRRDSAVQCSGRVIRESLRLRAARS